MRVLPASIVIRTSPLTRLLRPEPVPLSLTTSALNPAPSPIGTRPGWRAQEALSNAGRQFNTPQVSVCIELSPAQAHMTIGDDEDDFHVPEAVCDCVSIGKLGLAGMYERARSVGGTLVIRSAPGRGTAVSMTIPIGSGPREPAGKE